MHTPDFESITAFLQCHERQVARILFHAHGQLSHDDLASQAWLCAHDLCDELARLLDLTDEQDAALLMQALRRAADRQTRAAKHEWSLDKPVNDEADASAFVDYLVSDDGAHALTFLLDMEEAADASPEMELPDAYHSESAAWHWLALRFGNRTRDIAHFLLISASWCRKRRRRAYRHLASQRELPHTLTVSDDKNALRPWRKFKLLSSARTDEAQFAFDFWPSPPQPARGQLWLL